jgi:hypothetical protein
MKMTRIKKIHNEGELVIATTESSDGIRMSTAYYGKKLTVNKQNQLVLDDKTAVAYPVILDLEPIADIKKESQSSDTTTKQKTPLADEPIPTAAKKPSYTMMQIVKARGLIQVNIDDKITTYKGQNYEEKEGQLIIDGIAVTPTDDRIVPNDRFSVLSESMKQTLIASAQKEGHKVKIDALGNIVFNPQ